MNTNTKPWLAHYPEYLPEELSELPCRSLAELWETNNQQYGNRVACENMGKKLSYHELDVLSTHFAAFLQHHCHLKPGDRFAIQLPNVLQFPVAMLGALKAGLILVNTNPLYTSREMEHQFRDSGVKGILILANFAHNLQKILLHTSIQTIIVTELGDLLGGVKKPLVNFVVRKVKKLVPPYLLPGAVSFGKAIARGKKAKLNSVPGKPDDIAFLQYTGGTTGISKGAQLTHRNVLSNILQVKPLLQHTAKGAMLPGDVVVIPLPLYHIYALTACFAYLDQGVNNRLITNPKDLKAFIRELRKPFHNMIGVNTLYNALLNHPSFDAINFSALKGCTTGGMALQEVVFRRWQEKTGTTIGEGYGLSETSPVLTFQLPGKERMGSIGIPITSTEIKIMDDAGHDLPYGIAGELCARGPQVFSGYWNKDNSSVFHPGGWFKTGDMAVMSEDGYIRIVDRKKDMILVSGFNVYPNEIEGVVAEHSKVLEVAAVGIVDPHSGEAVKLFVVKKDPSLTEEELKAFCKDKLAPYKQPKHISFMDTLPKSNVGKILRRTLREEINV